MTDSSDAKLARLADRATCTTLRGLCLDWSAVDRNVAAAIRFKRQIAGPPAMVGLLGGASSGKSTLFNSLIGGEVSRISAHAHETLGPIAAACASTACRLESWIADGMILGDFRPVRLSAGETTTGRSDTAHIYGHDSAAMQSACLFDLPDVTSKMSADEGAISRNLLAWFDGLLVVADEERWFDAAVFDEILEGGREFGPRLWIVFNRTENGEALSPAEAERLERHARRYHADGHSVSPFQPGQGYRPICGQTRAELVRWMAGIDGSGRVDPLVGHLQRRCAEVTRANMRRVDQFERLCSDVGRQLSEMASDASLTIDLLTAEERRLLGLGHRFLPFYDVADNLRRRISGLGRKQWKAADVDFDKQPERLAEVLRRNLEARFQRATDRIDEATADSRYLAGGGDPWSNRWTMPSFDEQEWARRIRAHIESWRAEAARQARTADAAAATIGLPLLAADILFLGGAGVTLTWAAAWLAGLFGGKGLARLVQRSRAFDAYQTTVRAYQTFLREALIEQWEANLEAMPRRHLKMTDPILEALMHWSTPVRAPA